MKPAASVLVRMATGGDADELARLRWDFSKEDTLASDLSWSSFLDTWTKFYSEAERRGWRVWVAESDGRLVANMWVQLVEKVPRPFEAPTEFGYLTNCFVRSESRRQGIGTRILHEIKTWAIEGQLEMLVVWPSTDSVEFYSRAGFLVSRSAQEPGEEAMELHLR